jgi:hypothetical protein
MPTNYFINIHQFSSSICIKKHDVDKKKKKKDMYMSNKKNA